MHKHRLKTLLNFSGLGLPLIARRCLLGGFLLYSVAVSADCQNSVYPKNAAGDLFPSADAIKGLLAIEQGTAGLCALLAQDLAQLYFWGSADIGANLAKSYDYALRSRKVEQWPYDLRFLRSAYVLAGLDDSDSAEEALRQFQREIDSGEPLRRDKALATLNQLLNILPPSRPIQALIYTDRQYRQVIERPNIIAVLTKRGPQIRLLLRHEGTLKLAWARASEVANSKRDIEFEPALRGLYPEQAGLTAAGEVRDSRHQVWRTPDSAPDTGVLISRFIQRDGSLYEARCTATHLNGRWLISAAHCLYAADGSQNLVSLRYIASPLTLGNSISVAAVWVHAGHNPADQLSGDVARYSGSDVALIKLSTALAISTKPRLAAPSDDRAGAWVDSFAYPSDKERDSLWFSRCRAGLWLRGDSLLSDLYSLDCVSYEGQSGAALLQTIAGEPHIVGVLSARVHSGEINQPVFSALNGGIIADINLLIESGANNLKMFRALAI